MPHLCFGGAERLASFILAELKRVGCAATLLIVGNKPEEADAAAAWFEPIVDGIIRLPADPTFVLEQVATEIRRSRPEFLAFIGRSAALHAAPSLRRLHPRLRLVGFQFNERELTLEHRLYAGILDLIVVEGDVVAQTLMSHGVSEDRIAVIPSGIDLAHWPLRESSTPLQPLVGFVGRMDPIKGPLDFVAICTRLATRPARFVMAGDGPSAGDVKRAIKKSGLASRFVWPGRLAHAALPGFYAQLSVLVAPSTLDGRPLVVQEAQACAVPVVASAVGSIPDLIEDGVSGILCPPGDHDRFAEAIGMLLDDESLRRRIGKSGRDRVVGDGGLAASLPLYLAALCGMM